MYVTLNSENLIDMLSSPNFFLINLGIISIHNQGFPGGTVVKHLPASAGDAGSIPGSGRSPREGNGTPLHYSCLGNPLDRGPWRAVVHGVTKE